MKIDLEDEVFIMFETWFHLNKNKWIDSEITSIHLYEAFIAGYEKFRRKYKCK